MILIFFAFVSLVLGLTPEEIAHFKPRLPDHIERNTGKKAVYSLTDNGDGSLTFRGNNIPPHDTWEFPNENGNPDRLEESNFWFTIPNKPKLRDTPLTCIPRGPIGVSTSGIMIFGNFANEVGCPYARDFEELDICDGHPTPRNVYHHHHYAHCIVQPVCGEPSPIVGVAIDGIPIYGPWDENGRQLTQQNLDECGGMTDSTGRYKYIMTIDPPFFMRCLKGEIRSDLEDKKGKRFVCTCPYDDRMAIQRPPVNGSDGQELGDNGVPYGEKGKRDPNPNFGGRKRESHRRNNRRRSDERMVRDERRQYHKARGRWDYHMRPDGRRHDAHKIVYGRDERRNSRPHNQRRPPYDGNDRTEDDGNYPDNDKKRSNSIPVCDFSDKSKTWANCSDKYDETYNLSREWSRSKKTIKLAACCPKGIDCGFSCKTDNGIKSSCYVEERKVFVIENKEKGWCKNKCTSKCGGKSNPSFCYKKCYDICQTGFGIHHVK